MGNKLKTILVTLILVTMILTAVPTFLNDMAAGATTVTGNTSAPTLLRLVFNFWWLPVGLIMLGVVTTGIMSFRGRRRSRRRR